MTQATKDAAKFLKSTLRLPSSTFPPRPKPADIAKYLPRCADDLYAWQRQERPAANTFVLHDGPPYANGDLHVGHALNKILKDIICRSRLAEGRRVDYVPGWDCHGLPIELKALEQHGWQRGQGVDPVAIRKAARKFAYKTVEKQMAGFRSWAVMGDWQNHWKTMDKSFEMRQLAVFQAMAQHGLIYRKHKPVYWSPSSGTALAEAELEYQDDHVSTAALVKFPLDTSDLSGDGLVNAVIWTTTPWTLPANQAIAIHSALQYSLVKSETHGLLIVARARVSYLEETIGEHVQVVLDSVPVDKLLQSTYSGLSQFGNGAANRPFVHADFVSAQSGTGLVHCAPGHGMEDYEALQPLIQASKVSVRAPVDNLGRFNDTASPNDPSLLAGKDVFGEGNKAILELLQESGLLVHQHAYKHKYPIDWRTKEPVIIRATAQWFADISEIKTDTMHALDTVRFLPETGRSRLRSFVENRSEWCISRQRAWGVPIPAIYHKTTGEAVLTPESIGHIIRVIDDRGIDAWWSDAPDDPRWIHPGLSSSPGSSEYVRGMDTMDVWFDSGTSWTLMLQDTKGSVELRPQSAPLADIYVEGTDQHRGWFQSSLLTNVAYQKSLHPTAASNIPSCHAPFRILATHGFTLDEHGKKMSKSLGNVIAPAQIIAGIEPASKTAPVTAKASQQTKGKREHHPLGPDALRMWVASSEWTKDVVISDKVVSSVHNALDKYRLTMRMLLGMLSDFDPRMLVPYEKMSRLDQMAMLQLYVVCHSTRKAYSDLELHKAASSIHKWVTTDLSSFYFEAIKDIIYCDTPTSERRLSAQTALHHILCQLQTLLGPITPLLVEESWEHSPESYKSALDHPLKRIWTYPPEEWYDNALECVIPTVMAINSSVKAAQEAARKDKLMGQSLASDVTIHLREGIDLSNVPRDTLREILVVSEVEIVKQGVVEIVSGQEWIRSSDIVSPEGQTLGIAHVTSPRGGKCARCWRYVVQPEASQEPEEPQDTEKLPLCVRCTDAVAEHQK
ncbi:isoleucyl-tRNA synthetase [Capronia epimyces CBS 606.96]|uniref:Isoleucine--tRNA ligase, mitochondrial n=1 Tax=Capronia epimyces CBS 606.96 TaxID=1182542 RepID=W9YA11_9EURO|nr:isoleucyl-tRNA synthetase [Capronia epimyces CBS 606.96]EXJ79224.1 isoleucyl-tRNA synthetase [Capronia epimyces CBS 606.96]